MADTLNISYNTAKTYIRLIKERWSDSSSVDELQIFEYASEINTLPEEEKEIALKMIREKISKQQV